MPYDYIEEYQKQDDETIWEFRDKDAQAKIDTSLTETDYANPLSLETMQSQLAKNTKIKLEPIQDLHGFTKPWVGGAGKNLLHINDVAYGIQNHVTLTTVKDSDGNVIGVNLDGNATGDCAFTIYGKGAGDLFSVIAGKTLKLYGGSNCSENIYLQAASSNGLWGRAKSESGSDAFIVESTEPSNWNVQVIVKSGTNCNNVKIYPMLCLSTESSAYEPYSNICPISGHNEIKIDGCGKNLVKFDSLSDYRTAKTNKVYVNGQETFTLSLKSIVKTAGIVAKDKNDVTVGEKGHSNTKLVSYTIPDGTDYVICYVGTSDAITEEIFNSLEVQLELGSSATDYEPFILSNNKTLDLPQTVYGGTLDLESGELMVDRGYDTVTWGNGTNASVLGSNTRKKFTKYYDAIGYTSATCKDISNKLALLGDYSTDVAHWYIDAGNNNLYMFMPNDTNSNETVDICYELATPTTIQLTPHQLSLLKAQNNLTTSQYTQVKVTYRNGIFATLEELSDTAQDIYDEISGDATTVSGNPINFTTREKQKSKSTIIDLEPIQDLHGYSKPWVGGAGKNLLNLTLTDLKTLNSTGGTWNNNVYTFREVVYTVESTNDTVTSIKVNGTANGGRSYLIVCSNINISLASQSYILSSENANIKTSIYDGTTSTYGTEEITFDYSSMANNWNGTIFVENGSTVTNQISKPMVRKSTTSAGFEPYENICPISGRSSIDIDGCGKNLWNNTQIWTSVKITFDNGIYKVNSNTNACCINCTAESLGTMPVSLKVGEEYRIVYESENAVVSNVYSCCLYYDGTWRNFNSLTFVPTKPVVSIGLALYGTFTTSTVFKNIQLSLSSNSRYYEPYTPSTDLTISFGTTVYGGRLDVEKGELVVDRTDEINLGDYTWTMYSSGSAAYFDATHNLSNIKNYGYGVCDCYELSQASTVDGMKNGQIRFNSNKFYIKDLTKASATELQNSLSGKYATCELATPQTIQLTPQQVQLLKGINNISTTGTTITVTFKNGSVAHLDDLPENVFTDLDEEKLASIDTLAITLDLLTHTLVVTQDI